MPSSTRLNFIQLLLFVVAKPQYINFTLDISTLWCQKLAILRVNIVINVESKTNGRFGQYVELVINMQCSENCKSSRPLGSKSHKSAAQIK
jgi:hypothetical protein